MERPDDIIQSIDMALAAPPVSIEQALGEAVVKKRMTVTEAQECLDAYVRSFQKGAAE